MIAKLAYLTSPAPNVFMLNLQLDDAASTYVKFEISKAHLANILIDGCALALRDSSRPIVKLNPANEALNVERAD